MLDLIAAAQRIGCKAGSVRRMMSEGRCPGAKIAGHWRVDADVLETWLAERQRPVPTEPVTPPSEFPSVANPFN